MENMDKIIHLIESYINNIRKRELNFMYGEGSRVEVQNLQYLTTSKSLLIDCTVIFGQTIDEEMFNIEFLEILMSDTIAFFFDDIKLVISVTYDV